MKRMIYLLSVLAILASFSSCAVQKQSEDATFDIVPNTSRMKSICELAVIDCYYHNIAKSFEPDAEGHLWWKKDRLFWIEYNAVARYGIDVTNLDISIDNNVITVYIPQAKLLGCTIDDPKDFEYIVAEDSAKITAEDEQTAISQAQAELKEEASNNAMLIAQAQQRAKDLLNEYIESINELGEKSYTVEFKIMPEDNSNKFKTDDGTNEQESDNESEK